MHASAGKFAVTKHFRRCVRISPLRTAVASLDAPSNHPVPVFTSSPAPHFAVPSLSRYHRGTWQPLAIVLCSVLSLAALPQHASSAQDSSAEVPAADETQAVDESAATTESATAEPGVPQQTQNEPPAPGDDVRDDPKALQEALATLPEDVRGEAQAAWDKFVDTGKTLASAMLALRSDQLRYRNGMDQTPDAALRYREQRTRTWQLMQTQFTNAIDLIRYLPSLEAARFVVTMVQYHLENDIYDAETYEAAARLLDLGQNYEFLFLAAARSAVVSGQFDAAKKIYDVLKDEGLKDVDLRLKHQLDVLEQQYKHEQAAIARTDSDKLPHIRVETTQGDVLIELFPDAAPSAVAHFRKLVKEGFYDGMDFSLVSQSLLAMTGDNTDDGRGNTGEFLIDEHGRDESRHGMRGSVVMAKLPIGDGKFIDDSASSQIAILFLPITAMSSTQSVIGRVIEGMDVISKLRRIDPTEKKEQNQIQLPPDAVLKTEIVRYGDDLPDPKYVDLKAEIEKAIKAGLLKPKTPDAAPE